MSNRNRIAARARKAGKRLAVKAGARYLVRRTLPVIPGIRSRESAGFVSRNPRMALLIHNGGKPNG